MKAVFFKTLVLSTLVAMQSCEKPCLDNKEVNFNVDISYRTPPTTDNVFTKIYAVGTSDSFIKENPNGFTSSELIQLPINISTNQTQYIFENANGNQKRLTLAYELKPIYESSRCGYRFILENISLKQEESDFTPEQMRIVVSTPEKSGLLRSAVKMTYEISLTL
jgi:Family of unknown function (DUF6452)